jgi:hypothetical protein
MHKHQANKNLRRLLLVWGAVCLIFGSGNAQTQRGGGGLKVIFIRHAEKPPKGDNLTCQGFNRSVQLPALITSRYGVPDHCYVPAIGLGESTKHSRMFQTILPLAIKYNLTINTQFEEKDSVGLAGDILKKKGTILVVWEHKAISSMVHSLGIKDSTLFWPDEDYESIWILDFTDAGPVMKREKENLTISAACPF